MGRSELQLPSSLTVMTRLDGLKNPPIRAVYRPVTEAAKCLFVGCGGSAAEKLPAKGGSSGLIPAASMATNDSTD
jgi:hypothetical protein